MNIFRDFWFSEISLRFCNDKRLVINVREISISISISII